jgi:hypothetical protein
VSGVSQTAVYASLPSPSAVRGFDTFTNYLQNGKVR